MKSLEGTVLGLEPAFFPVIGKWLNGFATKNNRTFKKVSYPNIPSAANAARGVAALDDMLHSIPGPKIVFGHSMGSQVASKWLREMAPTSNIPHDQIVFVLCGNPERKYGGALMVPCRPTYLGMAVQPTYGGPGIPDNVCYRVYDYARQYDWWADSPTVEKPSKEAQAAVSQVIHCNYFSVGFDDPDVLSYSEGNRTYMLKPTDMKPSRRAAVESSYARPMKGD